VGQPFRAMRCLRRCAPAMNNLLRPLSLFVQPEAHADMEEIGDGLRHFPLGNYLILYRITPTMLEVVRVLHVARLR
jgi:hypothetical protein